MNLDQKHELLTDGKRIYDLIDLFVGDSIGHGVSRDVYNYALNDKWVIKIETEFSTGDNWIEYRIWQNVKHCIPSIKNWFAPCYYISPCGRVLIQHKTTPISEAKKPIPEKVPAYFTDINRYNFGFIGNNFTCHDYSLCLERFGFFGLNNKMRSTKELF